MGEAAAVDAGSSPASPRPRRALVVDDEPSLREVMVTMLETLGVRADAVASGVEALAQLARGSYDLVVTDLVMPRMTGWEVIAAIRERGLGVAVVLASGSISNLEESSRAEDLGVVVLRKPFRIGELAEAVAAATRQAAGAPAPPVGATRVPVHPENRQGGALAPEESRSVTQVMQAMRRAAQDLQALFAAVDLMVDERERLASQLGQLQADHEELRRVHEALAAAYRVDVTALAELREAYQRLARGHEQAQQTLVALRDELDRVIRELGPPPEV